MIILLYIVPVIMVLIPLYLGERYAKRSIKNAGEVKEGPIGSIVGASFALLAFLLAFTFQIVESRYGARKELVLKESGEIRSAYHLAGLIPDSLKKPARQLLKEYVDIRLTAFNDREKVPFLLTRSSEIIDELWKSAEYLNTIDRSSEAYSLYASSIISVSETFHERKIIALNYKIPTSILVILSIITVFCMLLLGYQIGVSGKINYLLNLILALIFGVVIWMILVLDRPELGIAKINQQPLIDLQQELHSR